MPSQGWHRRCAWEELDEEESVGLSGSGAGSSMFEMVPNGTKRGLPISPSCLSFRPHWYQMNQCAEGGIWSNLLEASSIVGYSKYSRSIVPIRERAARRKRDIGTLVRITDTDSAHFNLN